MTDRTRKVISGIGGATASEWIAARVSRSDLSSQVARGELVKIRYGVYASAAAAATASTDQARAHALHVAAVAARIGGGVASHQSAAVLA